MPKSLTQRTRTPNSGGMFVKKRGRRAASKMLVMKSAGHALGGGILRGERVEKVLARAAATGLLSGKDARLTGRVSPQLIERAKSQTGIVSNTELLEFALANVALEDNFADTFRELKGTVNPALDLGY